MYVQANVLQACIMHRTLGIPRAHAIEAMRDAYRGRSAVPIATFTHLLCFDSTDEAVAFAFHYGQKPTVCGSFARL